MFIFTFGVCEGHRLTVEWLVSGGAMILTQAISLRSYFVGKLHCGSRCPLVKERHVGGGKCGICSRTDG